MLRAGLIVRLLGSRREISSRITAPEIHVLLILFSLFRQITYDSHSTAQRRIRKGNTSLNFMFLFNVETCGKRPERLLVTLVINTRRQEEEVLVCSALDVSVVSRTIWLEQCHYLEVCSNIYEFHYIMSRGPQVAQ